MLTVYQQQNCLPKEEGQAHLIRDAQEEEGPYGPPQAWRGGLLRRGRVNKSPPFSKSFLPSVLVYGRRVHGLHDWLIRYKPMSNVFMVGVTVQNLHGCSSSDSVSYKIENRFPQTLHNTCLARYVTFCVTANPLTSALYNKQNCFFHQQRRNQECITRFRRHRNDHHSMHLVQQHLHQHHF